MRSNLVQVGNSRGVRIPKAFLQQAKLEDEIEREVVGSHVVKPLPLWPRAATIDSLTPMLAP
ncbi:MAG: AbrB/MazE/SpoVT family DNA-binding domain-containing protein [Acidobacteriota bacterium]